MTGATDRGLTTTYQYDPVGNRKTRTRVALDTTYNYDKADHILNTQVAGAVPTNYTVNANGNETARGADTFSYDQANRLTSVGLAGVQTFQYGYDGDGKRVSSSILGVVGTSNFTYDVTGSLPLLLDDGSRKYVWGLGELYNVDKTTAKAQVYHTDGLGSVRAITDDTTPNALVIQTYRTDEFGIPDPSGTMGASTQSLQYTGEQRDAESNFMYLRARMYDPNIGRFMQADPLRKSGPGVGGWNRYSYVANTPTTATDPSGRYSYLYDWYIAPIARVASAATVMAYFQQHPREIFPFDLGQCQTIEINERCDLGVVLGGLVHRDPVRVTAVTATSFTFMALPGHFDPAGSTVKFSLTEHDGWVHLSQKAHALRPDEGSPADRAIAVAAYVMWSQQAWNLIRAVDPVYRDYPPLPAE